MLSGNTNQVPRDHLEFGAGGWNETAGSSLIRRSPQRLMEMSIIYKIFQNKVSSMGKDRNRLQESQKHWYEQNRFPQLLADEQKSTTKTIRFITRIYKSMHS